MAEIRKRVRHMPRIAKLLTALLSCALVVTLIAVATAGEITVTPENSYKDESLNLEFSRPTGKTYPGYKTYDGDPYEYWKYDASTELKGEVQTCLTDSATNFDANTGVLRITNKGTNKIFLSFNYSVSSTYTSYVLKIGDETINYASGNYISSAIAPDSFVEIWLTANEKYGAQGLGQDIPTANIALTNIKVEAVKGQALTLLTPENGSYTAASSNQTIANVTMAAGATASSISFNPAEDETVTLTASNSEGYAFYMWVDESGTPLSQNNPVTVDGSTVNTASIRPVFVSKTTENTPSYQIPGSGKLSGNYYYWDDAMNAALNGPEKNVVLLTDVTLSSAINRQENTNSTTFTIPNGVTLVVPYNEKLSTGTADSVNTSDATAAANYGVDENKNTTDSAYRTLTVPTDCTLNVNGTLNVNALQGSSNTNGYQSHVVGDYGYMVVAGTVNVNAGGTLYARGYVTGTGNINVQSNGTLYQMMQIVDWRGGTYSVPVANSKDYPTLPFSGYYLQNNMVHTKYFYGSSMKAQAVIAATLSGYQAVYAAVPVISNGDASNPSFFVMNEGASVETEYDKANDRLKVTLNGNTGMNCLKLSVGAYDLTTEGKELAVSDNLQVTVASGKMTIAGGLKFLPGAKLTVNSGAKLEIAEGGKAFFYAAADYNSAYTFNAWRNKLLVSSIIQDTSKYTPTEDAALDLHGTLVVNGMLALSKNHPGLTANDGASVTVNNIPKATKLKLYEPDEGRTRGWRDTSYTLPTLSDEDVTAILVYQKLESRQYNGAHVFENRGWTSLKGPMVDDTTAVFEKGTTYQVNDGKWYSHALTLAYTTSDGNETKNNVYTIDDTYTYASPTGYAITGIQVGETGVVYANADTTDSNSLADGWTSVKLSNLPATAELTLSVKAYTQKLIWKSMVGDTVTMTNYSYLYGDVTNATLTYNKALTVNSATVTDATGAVTGDTTCINKESDKTTVTVTKTESGSLNGKIVTVVYTGEKAVTWNVTDTSGNTTTTVDKLGENTELTYTITQPTDGWLIAGSVESQDTSIQVVNNNVTVTVKNISGPVTVNIKLKAVAHKLTTNITTVDADGDKTTGSDVVVYTDNTVWTYEPAEKHIVAQYNVTGGTLTVSSVNEASSMDTDAITEPVIVTLSGKETTIRLTDYAYFFCLTWNAVDASQDSKPTVDEVSYREYVTGESRVEQDSWDTGYYYKTFRTNKTAGECYWDNDYEVALTYSIPDNARYAYTGGEWGTTVKSYPKSIYDQEPSKIKDDTVELEVKPYLYNVEIYDSADATKRLQLLCIGADGNDVATGESPVYKDWDTYGTQQRNKFISGYEMTGSATIQGSNDTSVTGIAVYGSKTNKGPGLSITAVSKDTTIKATFQSYVFCYKWNIAGCEEYPTGYFEFVTQDAETPQTGVVDKSSGGESHTWTKGKSGYSAEFKAPQGYYIQTILNDNYKNYINADKRSGTTVPGTGYTGNHTITLAPYVAYVACTIDNVAAPDQSMLYVAADSAYNVNATSYDATQKTWTYTLPEGKYIAENGVTGTDCVVMATSADKRSVTIGQIGQDSKLEIKTTTPATGYYMGDMSFEYVRNAAAYTWNGTGNSWQPVDSFVWRHTTGSTSFTDANTKLTYSVANGSILLVNGDSAEKTFTISATDLVTAGNVKMYANNTLITADGITITVPAGQQQTVTVTLQGEPNTNDKNADGLGTITVTKN